MPTLSDPTLEAIAAFLSEEHRLGERPSKLDLLAKEVETGNYVIAIGRVRSRLHSGRSRSRRFAIELGLLVRSVKLYEGFLSHIASNQMELAFVFARPLLETIAHLQYMLRNRGYKASEFIEIGYKAELRMIRHLSSLRKSGPLLPIEKRMLASGKFHLREDRISRAKLQKRTNWKLDGKDMNALLTSLGWDLFYVFGYMVSSHWTHGTWFDLKSHHVKKHNGRFVGHSKYRDPEPGQAAAWGTLLLATIEAFDIRHRPRGRVDLRPFLVGIAQLLKAINVAWEHDVRSRTDASCLRTK